MTAIAKPAPIDAEITNNVLDAALQHFEVAEDGFLDYKGSLEVLPEITTAYDGLTWAPHLHPDTTRYSVTVTKERLDKISQPITRLQIAGKLVQIEAFGHLCYAIEVTLKGENLPIILPEHRALYARLDRVNDGGFVVVTFVGWYEDASDGKSVAAKYDVRQLADSKQTIRRPLLVPVLDALEAAKKAKEAAKP